ncbi:MAG: STAS domain-containing protein [Candidatus Acidiferrum sp.]
MLTTTISRKKGVVVVSVGGRIYFGGESTCLSALAKDLLKETHRIVFDLEHVTHIDSGGVGALVSAYASARQAGGELKFSNLSAHTKEVLQTTNLLKLFETFASTNEAIASFDPPVVTGTKHRK